MDPRQMMSGQGNEQIVPPQAGGPIGMPPQEGGSQFAPPPASPGSPTLEDTSAGGFIGPEHLRQLDALAEKVRGKVGEAEATKFAGSNTLQSQKADLIREFLLKLQDSGVDITDPQAVMDYVESLREMYPDLADLFEEIVSGFLGDEADVDGLKEGEFAPMPPTKGGPSAPADGQAAGTKYENLSQNVREHIQK